MAGKVTVLTSEDFDDFTSKGNVIIDFYADWCGPCKIMAPEFEKASEDSKEVKFAKVNVDGNQDIAMRFGVMSIPTTVWMKDGELVDRFTGVLREEEINKKNSDNF